MSLKIKAGFWINPRFLQVDSRGVTYSEFGLAGGKKTFAFRDVQCILMSSDHTLSFQIANKTYSIPTKPGNRKHQATIGMLVHEVERTERAMTGFPAGLNRG
jgi:hypothetical protein